VTENTTGKKFAPKAARRRPGAAPKASAPEPAAPPVEAQTPQTEPESSTAADEPTPAAQLPTPAATQEPAVPHVSHVTPEVSAVTHAEPAVHESTPLPTPADTQPQAEPAHAAGTPPLTQPVEAVQDAPRPGRAATRRRLDPSAGKSIPAEEAAGTGVVETPAPTPQPDADEATRPQSHSPPASAVDEAAAAVEGSTPSVELDTAEPVLEEAGAPRPRKRRVLPWAAINRPQAEEEAAPALVKKTRAPPKPRGRKKAAAPAESVQGEEQEGAEEREASPVRKRPGAKARGKRKADAAVAEDGTEAPLTAKRIRRPREARNAEGAEDAGEGRADEQVDEPAELVVRRKPRAPRRRKKTPAEGEDRGDHAITEPKRRGRPPREATPSDAEDHEIDPDITFMDSIASRNIRVGKLSTRERAMREIDWVAVRQRQREEDARPVATKEAREAAEKLLIEEAPVNDGPRYQVVDGRIQVVHNSTMLDREADADREIENYEVLEERDLTTRITSRSFLKNGKRFPNDFILPGQGKRWTHDDTELFYKGLRNFGTDFQMISHMFPGSTRRSMKLKFTREEREDPERVRECLLGASTIVTGWDDFIEVSQMQEQQFADADAIKREMAEQEAEMREKILAARAETDERKRQQREAGLLDEEGVGGEGEGVKGKKKRKSREKQVAFREEVGVEIVGAVDDDDTWGQE
jgi:transcription factor TFIIIB component B''